MIRVVPCFLCIYSRCIRFALRTSMPVAHNESEELLAEAVVVLNGVPLTCTYIHEQMELALLEVEDNSITGVS